MYTFQDVFILVFLIDSIIPNSAGANYCVPIRRQLTVEHVKIDFNDKLNGSCLENLGDVDRSIKENNQSIDSKSD